MDDKQIIDLYFERNEQAILHTQEKYGKYLESITHNILKSVEDSEECVNDTYIKAWDTMPPHRPERLSAFLGRITRNISLDRYDKLRAQKRSGCTELALDELLECVPDTYSDMPISDEIALRDAINGFLSSLPTRTRVIFMRRYFYMCSVSDIAQNLNMSESNVKVTLLRARQKFKERLEKEGIVI